MTATPQVVPAPPTAPWPPVRGTITRRALRADPSLEYLSLVPSTGAFGAPVFVSVHGLRRRWDEQARAFASFCEHHGVAMLAPCFTADHHPDYQRLGRVGRGERADRFLLQCLQEFAALTSADVSRVHLFGFSAGAQFVHRFVMAYPHRVARAVVAGAGWYTWPDPTARFPRGTRHARGLPGVVFDPEAYLRVPVTVLVGEQDVGTVNLRADERTVALQGEHRVERAQRWVAAMRSEAAAHGLEPRVQLVKVARVGHSFSQFCEHGALASRVFAALFDPEGAPAPDPGPGVSSARPVPVPL